MKVFVFLVVLMDHLLVSQETHARILRVVIMAAVFGGSYVLLGGIPEAIAATLMTLMVGLYRLGYVVGYNDYDTRPVDESRFVRDSALALLKDK